jgi:serine/threonine protein kinase
MRPFAAEAMGADAAAEEQFGPYLVYERLGVGGMATVHRALERGIEGFERVVALKRLLPHLAADGSFIKSFVREAKLASLLNHVNIVQIFELGRVGTEYFISMEYIDGRDIRRILRHARKVSGPPPIHVTVGLLLQLCDALDYAHHKVDDSGTPLGLVHRDVSPSNVLVTSAGQVKVIDFGIAKAQSVQLRTQTGRVKGKLAYMAPEALAGKDLDARSDVFAAGVIAHELLTARPLFATKNEYQTLMKVQRGEIMPPSTFNQACPPELDAIVLRALARDPDERFLHASDMRDELHAMRRPYNLQTADRDIAMWLEWAFSLEAPSGNFTASHTFDPSSSAVDAMSAARRTPTAPRRAEDDESIDIAWGGVDEQHNGAPVVLDDVPDVSAKHLASASALGAEVRLDFDDLADDIPLSQPSHGVRPAATASSRAATASSRTATAPSRAATVAAASLLARPQPRTRPPTPAAPLRGSQAVPAAVVREHDGSTTGATRSAQHSIATPNLGIGVGVGGRSRATPARVRTITIPPLGAAAASAVPRTMPSLSPPPPPTPAVPAAPPVSAGLPFPVASPAAAAMPNDRLSFSSLPTPARGVPAIMAAMPSGPAAVVPPRMLPSASTAPRGVPAGSTPPFARPSTQVDNLPTERTPVLLGAVSHAGQRSARHVAPPVLEDFTLPSDTIPSMPAMHSTEPVVRFRAPSTTPPPAAPPPAAPPPAAPPPVAAPADAPPNVPATGTLPSVPPPAPRGPGSPSAPRAHRSRLITPATALFAEPEPDAESSMTVPLAPSSHGMAPSPGNLSTATDGAPRRHRPRRGVLVLLGAAVVLGIGVAAVTLYLTRPNTPVLDVRRRSPPPPPPTTTGTVKFAVIPTDAAITIEGKPPHTGSPWDVELGPGAYQIEIHRDGYKTWLTSADVVVGETHTLQVALEPLDAVAATATLVVDPPPGGELVLDGTPLPGGAQIRTPLTVGPHTIVLRKGGVDVWKTVLEARASAMYDLTPALTKQAKARSPTEPAVAEPAPPAPAIDPPLAPVPEPGARPSPLGEITPISTPPVPLPPAPASPVIVPSTAVTKLAGAPPSVASVDAAQLPPAISAKLCIDDVGHVTSSSILTPLAPNAGAEIMDALRTWQYTPYQPDGVARPACFVVQFRVK